MRRGLIPFIALAVVIGGAAWYFLGPGRGPGDGNAGAAAPRVGFRAPSITLTQMTTDAPVRLPEDLLGTPYAIAFFAYT